MVGPGPRFRCVLFKNKNQSKNQNNRAPRQQQWIYDKRSQWQKFISRVGVDQDTAPVLSVSKYVFSDHMQLVNLF